ncbi:MAG: nickel pincer cofactor biosynthesis protein LarC [Chloroflexales bacterium]
MRIAYFDCFHGAAGDMLLAALLDAGLAISDLETALAGLGLDGYTLRHEPVTSHGVTGSRLHIAVAAGQPQRDWAQIRALIAAAPLPGPSRAWALGAFARLARAEGAVHGVPAEQVHFHEVGAIDSLVDTVGVCVGLALLGVERVYASALPLGRGWVTTQHGPLPVPAPATLAVLAEARAPTLPAPPGSDGELVTPTAAALLAELATFRQPPMTVAQIGYGFGQKTFPRLNGLRVWIGETTSDEAPTTHDHTHDHSSDGHSYTHEPSSLIPHPSSLSEALSEALVELRCNLDDATGELIAYVIERLLVAGALDAWAAPLMMKKGRPAVQLACLARPEQTNALAAIILHETPTLGVRWAPVERLAAARDWVEAVTPWGPVRVKRKLLDGAVAGMAPEYEDCAALARAHGLLLAQIYAAALRGSEAG